MSSDANSGTGPLEEPAGISHDLSATILPTMEQENVVGELRKELE